MSISLPHLPHFERVSSSHVPGGFETDTEAEGSDDGQHAQADLKMSKLQDDSLLGPNPDVNTTRGHNVGGFIHNNNTFPGQHARSFSDSHLEGHNHGGLDNTMLEEAEMNRQLDDFESSFYPEFSHLSPIKPGDSHMRSDDSLFGIEEKHGGVDSQESRSTAHPQLRISDAGDTTDSLFVAQSPRTPPGHYKTPAPEQQELRQHQATTTGDSSLDVPNVSRLEVLSSSPQAARTVSRVQSMATIGGYETADDQDFPESPTKKGLKASDDPDATPRKKKNWNSSQASINTTIRQSDDHLSTLPSGSQSHRPKYLNSRSASSRLSYDSIASSATETSNATLDADFALQTGGAAPGIGLQRQPRLALSRSTSLGSIVSGVSDLSDEEGTSNKKKRTSTDIPDLSTLEEESRKHERTQPQSPSPAALVTPKPSNINLVVPSETVITKHVRDLEVPGTFARQYRQSQNGEVSPEKPIGMAVMTPSGKKGLTLKEHRSTVEKLGKENFDLKMKIHFLDQALERRSEDGIKEMITENVQLKSDRMRLEKENHGLRKQVRELQRKVESGSGEKEEDQGYATDEERKSPTAEEELMYLRERVEVNEIEISRLRKDGVERESEKRKLAEMVRSLGDRGGTGSDVGSREERDMWKDMLEAETIAREQSEEECKKLRDEITKLRHETFGPVGKARRPRIGGSVGSRSSSIEGSGITRNENAEIERLRHEISELQKMIGAQASTLTSRNKEKERLYQEIEDLKLGRMGGLRSIAGDSILDRSASRARSNSRASNATRFSRLSEPEREQFEFRVGELRDEVSHLKLTNQNLESQLQEAMIELDAVDAQAQADADQFNEELALLTQERDNALREAEEQDQAFQQLKNEAQEEIDGLGDELDAKADECARLEQELKVQVDDFIVLQSEMRSASEGLVRLEEDAQQNLARYQAVKGALDEASRELENLEKNFVEAESKIQRLTVQQESSHNEIAFLREEADGDKIKIGDLESLLKKVHLNLDIERDRAKDLERRLGEERNQKEVVTNQEKQEVEKMMNDLNREASAAKDELRRVKKSLSIREIEVSTYKERLGELEEGLRQVLRDPNATRSALVSAVTKMQRELDHTLNELTQAQQKLDEHQNLLANRDALLESSSLDNRKLSDMLERERQGRRQDKNSFDLSLKSHQQSARALSANEARVAELEQQRQTQRKQLSQLESSFKEQLGERNQILLNLWKKLSALCGPDWAHNHSLISGNLPSQEVVGNMLFWPGFSRNLLLAAKQVEDTLMSMKDKIKKVDRDLWKEYNTLSQTLEARTRKLERIEEGWEKIKLRQQELEAGLLASAHSQHHRGSSRGVAQTQQISNPDVMQKTKAENRLLKAELQLLQRKQSTGSSQGQGHQRTDSRASGLSGGAFSNDGIVNMDGAFPVGGGGIPTRSTSTHRSGVSRAQSASTVEQLSSTSSRRFQFDPSANSDFPVSPDRASLMIPTRSFIDPQPPTNGVFPRTPLTNTTNNGIQSSSSGIVASANASDAGTSTTTALWGMGQDRWIHRLRELERRLKAEREQRLIDRTGMRKRLEEREAVNESLRKELEREKVRRSWAEGDDRDGVASTAMSVAAATGGSEENILGMTHRGRDSEATMFGRISLNNRVVDVIGGHSAEESPVRSVRGPSGR